MPAHPLTRRRVLGGAALIGGAVLAGCSLRLEGDSPEEQARRAARRAGTEVVSTLAAQAEVLIAQATALSGNALAQRLAVHHRDQLAVLRAWEAAQGADPVATTALTTARQTGPRTEVQTLALAERDGVDEHGLQRYRRLAERERLTALGVLAHRVAAATLLTDAEVSGVQPGLPAEVAADLLPTLRAAQYAVMTATALTADQPTRTALGRTAAALDSWESTLTGWAGAKAPGDRLGYQVTPRPATPAARTELLRRVVGDTLDAAGRHLATVDTSAHMLSLVTYVGEVAAAGDRSGVPLTSFPALRPGTAQAARSTTI